MVWFQIFREHRSLVEHIVEHMYGKCPGLLRAASLQLSRCLTSEWLAYPLVANVEGPFCKRVPGSRSSGCIFSLCCLCSISPWRAPSAWPLLDNLSGSWLQERGGQAQMQDFSLPLLCGSTDRETSSFSKLTRPLVKEKNWEARVCFQC